MSGSQHPITTLDMSFMLRTIMAARGLSVSEMAQMAGVSKSTMEKYLAGPSSPRATAIASLSKALGLSADFLMFGEIDAGVELAYQLVFKAFAKLLEDLKSDSDLSETFSSLDADSKAFSDFVRDTAFGQAGLFKRQFNSDRLETRFEKGTIASL